jgi:hypothetical protein
MLALFLILALACLIFGLWSTFKFLIFVALVLVIVGVLLGRRVP